MLELTETVAGALVKPAFGVRTVTGSRVGEEVPQGFEATTEMVPPVAPAVATKVSFPCPLTMLQPLGSCQV
jgi:hypothetical protein